MHTGIGLYVKGSAQAVELYKEAFGLELGYHVLNDDGSFFHSELCREGKELISVVENRNEGLKDTIVQVGMLVDNAEQVQKAFDVLSVDAREIDLPVGPLPWSPCATSLTDRFGVWWYISAPQHKPEEDFDPNKE